MIHARTLRITAMCLLVAGAAAGCRSTNRVFQMDSNSRIPWFGMDMSLPKSEPRRHSLETISDTSPQNVRIATAELRVPAAEPKPGRSLLPRWLTGRSDAIPVPTDAPKLKGEQTIQLEGPAEEFP